MRLDPPKTFTVERYVNSFESVNAQYYTTEYGVLNFYDGVYRNPCVSYAPGTWLTVTQQED